MLSKFKSHQLNEIFVRNNTASCEKFNSAIYNKNFLKYFLLPIHFLKLLLCLGESLTKSISTNRVQFNYGIKWKNILHKIATTATLCLALIGISSISSGASAKTILGVPATIQSEDFIASAGVKNVATLDIGGGAVTGSIDAGNWMSYVDKQVNLPVTGYYIISYRVASLKGGGSFDFNNIANRVTKIDTVTVPKTGSWLTWVTVQRKVYLKKGAHYFGIQVLTGGFQLNWFKITLASEKSAISVASSSVSSKASSSKSSSSSSSKSSVASSSKSSSSIDSLYTHIEGTVGLSWLAPKQREDKTLLDITELGGYQLRYKRSIDKTYTYIIINDPWTRTYNFDWLEGDYVFQIAAFDKLGVLSDFTNFTD